MKRTAAFWLAALAWSAMSVATARAEQPNREVYRCPGPPVMYTDTLSAKEARDKGCRTIEGAPITIVQGVRPRPTAVSSSQASAPRPGNQRVDPAEQKARDSDARRILEEELKREQTRLAQMQAEYKGGQPDRQGDERNYQKYLDRVADMKSAIDRKEADIAALQREIGKLPK